MLNIDAGYKFETLSLIPDTWAATSRDSIENRENEIVNNYAQYCSIVKTGIGKTKMIIGGEVDAGKVPNLISNRWRYSRYTYTSPFSMGLQARQQNQPYQLGRAKNLRNHRK